MNSRRPGRWALLIAGCAIVAAPTLGQVRTTPEALPRKGATIMRSGPDQPKPTAGEAFGGSVLITPDADWRARWNAQGTGARRFTEAGSVARGQKLWALVTFSNPGIDRNGQAHVACDLRMVRPDGKPAVEQKGLSCFDGALTGERTALYLATQSLEFVGDPGDPAGTWRVEVVLRDKVRKVEVPLLAAFTLR